MTDVSSHSTQHSAEPEPDFINWLKQHCIPILGTMFGALLLCFGARYSSITVDWTRTKDITEAFNNVTQSVALIAAGVWAYIKFAKGRTFRDRLIANVSGRTLSISESVFLIVTTQLKNVGLSRIALDQEASSLLVFEYVPSREAEMLSVKNRELTSFRVLRDNDRYIEPNEVVEHQTLIALQQVSNIGYQLELRLFSDSGYGWRTTTIVDKSNLAHNEKGNLLGLEKKL